MIDHSAIGISALLSTAAVGYFVCAKANTEKKGSNMKTVGLGLGSLIIIISLLASLCIVSKVCNKGYSYKKEDFQKKCMLQGKMKPGKMMQGKQDMSSDVGKGE